jgi:hypothetical protein
VNDLARSLAAAAAMAGWRSVRFMAVASEKTHQRARPAHDEAIAVVLDLVHPAGPRGWLGGQGRDARVDKAIGAARCHGGEMPACSGKLQPSDCRGTDSLRRNCDLRPCHDLSVRPFATRLQTCSTFGCP